MALHQEAVVVFAPLLYQYAGVNITVLQQKPCYPVCVCGGGLMCSVLWADSVGVCVYVSRFRASLYPCPETPQERKEMLAGVNSRIDDLQMVRSSL